jgi:hypothetical protein
VTTVPVRVTGGTLWLNANVRGSAQIELLDREGKVLPGYAREDSQALTGNALNHAVSWQGATTLAPLLKSSVRLKIYLNDGDLYSFGFSP